MNKASYHNADYIFSFVSAASVLPSSRACKYGSSIFNSHPKGLLIRSSLLFLAFIHYSSASTENALWDQPEGYNVEASRTLYYRLKQTEEDDEEIPLVDREYTDLQNHEGNSAGSSVIQLVEQVLADMISKNSSSAAHPMINAVFTTTFLSSDDLRTSTISSTKLASFTQSIASTTFPPTTSVISNALLDDTLQDGLNIDAEPMTVTGYGGVIPIIVVGLLFAFATTAGNLLVMISIRLDKQLQTISNYFLFSLAVADITIGIISIPLMTYYTAVQYWGIGYAACQFWLSVDYLMSNASVLNLLLISFDRYFSVTRPLTYRPRRTTRKALIMIAGTYILSAVLWPPWIIGWPYIEGKFTVEEGVCVVQFLALSGRNWATQLATVGTAIAAFYLPVTIMIILYYRVFRETKRRQEEFRRLQSGQIRGMGARAAAGAYPVSSSFGGAASVTSENAPPSQPEIATSILKRQLFPFSDVDAKPTKPKGRLSWLKYCVGKTPEMQSEDSSDGIAQAMDDTSCTSSMYAAGSIRKPKHTSGNNLVNLEPDQVHMTKADSSQSPLSSPLTAGNHLNGSCARFRTRVGGRFTNNIPDRGPESTENSPASSSLLRTYKVLIEYGSEGKRPSVRLSSCDQQSAALDGPTTKDTAEEPTDQCLLLKKKRHSAADVTTIGNGQVSTSIITKSNSANLRAESDILEIGSRSSAKRDSQNSTSSNLQFQNRQMNSNGRSNICGTAVGTGIKHMSGSASLREEHIRKSEKERRKNERKQESKAAKTLSAILFAFIVTWTPYNVIVCWEAFFPNSIPDVLFTFSYCLCYVNSTINPLCYALCNARFRMTYMRILRCKNWKPGHKASLYRHAYLRRA